MALAVLGKTCENKRFTPDPEIDKYIDSLVVKKSDDTRIMMYTMYHNLDEIFGFKVPVITGQDFNSFVTSEEGVRAREKFNQVAHEHPEILNPMYDYHAACILLEQLKINEVEGSEAEITKVITELVSNLFTQKEQEYTSEIMRDASRYILLTTLDQVWKSY
ncbi:MAG: hypothetical protein EBY20_10345 [Alphaproteobacteria bacterium]|nr:hypothetical protein [Alphaproteobacteria bacterium]